MTAPTASTTSVTNARRSFMSFPLQTSEQLASVGRVGSRRETAEIQLDERAGAHVVLIGGEARRGVQRDLGPPALAACELEVAVDGLVLSDGLVIGLARRGRIRRGERRQVVRRPLLVIVQRGQLALVVDLDGAVIDADLDVLGAARDAELGADHL